MAGLLPLSLKREPLIQAAAVVVVLVPVQLLVVLVALVIAQLHTGHKEKI
jgi:hypothetical protein